MSKFISVPKTEICSSKSENRTQYIKNSSDSTGNMYNQEKVIYKTRTVYIMDKDAEKQDCNNQSENNDFVTACIKVFLFVVFFVIYLFLGVPEEEKKTKQ